jgi:magnesium-transporting ATPase (P-type)
MITEDSKASAKVIGEELGLIDRDNQEEYAVMDGSDFYELVGGVVCKNCIQAYCYCQEPKTVRNIQSFKNIASHLRILSRTRPEDIYTLVTGLQ